MVAIQSYQTHKLTKNEELKLGALIKQSKEAKEQLSKNKASPEEKRKLSMQVEVGERAVSQLVEANINLVVSIATKYKEKYPYAAELEECVQDGLSGLIIAARKYDSERNNKFSTMAFAWVRQAITRGTNNTARLVRLPENRIEDYTDIVNIETELLKVDSTMNRQELDAEIKEITGLTSEDIFVIKNAASGHYSLNRKVSHDDDSERELMDVILQSEEEASAEQEALDSHMVDKLMHVLEELEEMEQYIVLSSFEMYFPPLENGDLLNARSVKKHFGIDSRTYKQTLNEALEKLHGKLSANGLTFADFL